MSSAPIITKQVPESENHRSSLRHRVESLTYLDLGSNNGGFLIDVSEGGVHFQVVQPLVTDQVVHFKFKLPDIHDVIDAKAQVAWVNGSGKGGGLRFLDLAESARLRIQEWLTAQTAQPRFDGNGGVLDLAAETKQSLSSPEPPSLVRQGGSSSETMRPHVQSVRDSALAPPLDASVVEAGRTVAAIFRPEDSERASGLPDRPLEAVGQQSRLTPFVLKILGSLAAAAILGTILLQLYRGQRLDRFSPTLKAAVDSPLELKLERSGTDWRVSWNRSADVLLQAVGGHLSITDGPLRKELDLDPSELRSGSIMYAPATDDVVVRLQVVGGNLAQPVGESVRIIAGDGPRISPQMAASRSSSSESTSLRPEPPPAAAPKSITGKPANGSSTHTHAALTRPPVKAIPLKMESPKVRGGSEKIEASADSVSPSPIVISGVADPGLSTLAPSTLPEAAPNLLSESPPPSPPLRAPVPRGGKLDPPQLIARREPIYPSKAAQIGLAGEVEVHFVISQRGTVHDVTVVRGNPLLADAAVGAILGWRYKPALLNGTPVETESSTVFVFKPK